MEDLNEEEKKSQMEFTSKQQEMVHTYIKKFKELHDGFPPNLLVVDWFYYRYMMKSNIKIPVDPIEIKTVDRPEPVPGEKEKVVFNFYKTK